MNRRLPLAFLTVLCALFCACDDYDDFTTSPDAVLWMAVDTLRFDTTITTVSTPTKSFVVYNRGKEGLRISRVSLAAGAASPFRVNVDGESLTGGEASDFIVRGGDSLFVFVEATMSELGHDGEVTVIDDLTFTLESGVRQSVALKVTGRDGIFWYDKVITTDTTLTASKPFVLYGQTVVAEGICLTLAPGTTLMFHPEASLRVDGTIVAQGTRDSMVVMRGDRTDRMFTNLLYDNTPMRWGGVLLTGRSHGNVFTCTDLHSATWGLQVDTTDVRLDSCVIHNIGGSALTLNAAECMAFNTQLSNALHHCLDITGGSAQFTYCTLAQFYPWTAGYGAALRFTNRDVLGATVPLQQAHFVCCLITGYAPDVVEGSLDDPDGTVNFLFDSCFIKTPSSEGSDQRFHNVTFQDEDITKRFVLFNTTDFLYDFHLLVDEPVPYGIR